MYEKPHYLTPDGYKRLSRNPNKEKTSIFQKKAVPPIVNNHERLLIPKQRFAPKKQISKEAAMLIAMAIKGMLNSK